MRAPREGYLIPDSRNGDVLQRLLLWRAAKLQTLSKVPLSVSDGSHRRGTAYRRNHPPIRPDEHSDAPQLNVNLVIKPLFAFGPRSHHFRSQPRTHATDVSPPGALTINSKSGVEVCARPTAHPINSAAATNVRV